MAFGQIIGQTPVNPKTTASNVSYDNSKTSSIITGQEVQTAIDQLGAYSKDLFTSVSNGKNKIASAITDKGVSTSPNDSFDVMAQNIGKIVTSSIGVFYTKNNQIVSRGKTITIPKLKPEAKLLFIAWMSNTSQFGNYSYAITPVSNTNQSGDDFIPFSTLGEVKYSIGDNYSSVTGPMNKLFSKLNNYADRYELTLDSNSIISKAIFITV